MFAQHFENLPGKFHLCETQRSEAWVWGSWDPTMQQSDKNKEMHSVINTSFIVSVNVRLHCVNHEITQCGRVCSLPCQQNQWPEWTRCRGWSSNSWLQQCERLLRGWLWTCCWIECPICWRMKDKDEAGVYKQHHTDYLFVSVTYIMSFWSSATEPNSDSWSRCQETSSTTAVWPVKMVLASTIFPSFGPAPMSHRQIVCGGRSKWREQGVNLS